jgi:hypothetical protein
MAREGAVRGRKLPFEEEEEEEEEEGNRDETLG